MFTDSIRMHYGSGTVAIIASGQWAVYDSSDMALAALRPVCAK